MDVFLQSYDYIARASQKVPCHLQAFNRITGTIFSFVNRREAKVPGK
jgi:hypothetical protein